jgi:hypothetical protein
VGQIGSSRFHRSGTERIHHPLVGDVTLSYERLELPSDTGLAIVTYSAERGSPSEARLQELRDRSSTRSRLAVVDVLGVALT